jgi:hypothetical protein
MNTRRLLSASLLCGVAASLAFASLADAQSCLGTPRRGGVSYVNGAHAFGTSHGGAAVFTPGREAFGVGAHVTDNGANESGYGGTFRFSFVRGTPVQVCPTLAVGFEQREWKPNPTTLLTSNEFSGRAGVAAGYDYTLAKDLGIAPFVAVEYVHRITALNLRQRGFDVEDSNLDRGGAEVTYGVMVRYWRVFAGASAVHSFEAGPPTARRVFAGFSF